MKTAIQVAIELLLIYKDSLVILRRLWTIKQLLNGPSTEP